MCISVGGPKRSAGATVVWWCIYIYGWKVKLERTKMSQRKGKIIRVEFRIDLKPCRLPIMFLVCLTCVLHWPYKTSIPDCRNKKRKSSRTKGIYYHGPTGLPYNLCSTLNLSKQKSQKQEKQLGQKIAEMQYRLKGTYVRCVADISLRYRNNASTFFFIFVNIIIPDLGYADSTSL